jgi:hypothetical protein
MSYEITQEKLTKANKLLLKDLHNTLGIDKTVLSNNQLLQKLSQALFSKPYEELKETLLLVENKNLLEVPKVFLLYYSKEIVMTLNGAFYKSTCLDDDNDLTEEIFEQQAYDLAKHHKSSVDYAYLPEIITIKDDGFDYADVILIAKEMGYFKYKKTIFELIQNDNSKVFIDGEHTHFKLDGEWESEMVSEWDGESDISSHTIWNTEVGDSKSHNFREFYFSFKNLCDAYLKDDGSWIIKEDNGFLTTEYLISFAF